MVNFKKIFKLAGTFIPVLFILYLGFILLKGFSPNLFLASSPQTFSMEEIIFPEKIESGPDLFAEENSNDKTDETPTETVEYTGVGGPDNMQETLDDIAEKFDILRQQALKLIEEYNSSNNNLEENSENNEPQVQQQNEPDDSQAPQQNTPQQNNSPNTITGGGSGGGGISSPIFSKILISEVQISPAEQRFVELYNPNNFEVSLTGWYLQRKTETGTSWNSFISSPKFEGKTILANDYFLISESATGSDIVLDLTLTENNSLVLKNPNRDISDKLGFGSSQDFETSPAQNPDNNQSLGRVFNETSLPAQAGQTYLDTDNNSIDFELDAPTPKAKNIKYIEPPVEEKDIAPPEVSFNLNPIQNNIVFTVNFEITDIVGTVTPSGIAIYIFQWKEEGGDWQEDAPAIVSGSPSSANFIREFIEGQDEKTYYFQIKAKDSAGNESVWLPEIPVETKISIPKKVLINEIQIDNIVGRGGRGEDWVELYNPNNITVSLAGWSIQKHSKSDSCPTDASFSGFYKKNFSDDAVILAKEFFLVADTNIDDSLKNIADMIIGWSLSRDNTIYLVRNQDKIENGDDVDIIDKVGFGFACFSETSPAPNPPEAKSIKRNELGQDTNDNSADFIISDAPTPRAE